MLESLCVQSAVNAANNCVESRHGKEPASMCEDKATVWTTWRTRRRTRPGTRAGRKLIRHNNVLD